MASQAWEAAPHCLQAQRLDLDPPESWFDPSLGQLFKHCIQPSTGGAVQETHHGSHRRDPVSRVTKALCGRPQAHRFTGKHHSPRGGPGSIQLRSHRARTRSRAWWVVPVGLSVTLLPKGTAERPYWSGRSDTQPQINSVQTRVLVTPKPEAQCWAWVQGPC